MYSKQKGPLPCPLEDPCGERGIEDMGNCNNGGTPINSDGNDVPVPVITSVVSALAQPAADIVVNPSDERKEQGTHEKDKRREIGSQSPQCGSGPFSSQISLGFNQSDFTLSQGIHSVPLHELVREESVREKAGICSSGSSDNRTQDEDSCREEIHTAPNPPSHWDSREKSDIRLPTVQSILNAPWDPPLPQTTPAPSISAIVRDAIVHSTSPRLLIAVHLQSDLENNPPSPPSGITPLLDTEHSPSPLTLNESPGYDPQVCGSQGPAGLAFPEFVNDSGTVDNSDSDGTSVFASTQARWDHYSHAAFPIYQQSGHDQYYVSQGLVSEHADITRMSTRNQSADDPIGPQNLQTEGSLTFNGQRTEQFDVPYEQLYGQQQSVRPYQQQNQKQGYRQQTQRGLERQHSSMSQDVSSFPLSSKMLVPVSSDQLQVPSSNYSSSNIGIIPVQIRQDLEALGQDSKYCSNCRITNTPSWRRCPKGQTLLCNACGLYQRLHGRSRPFIQTKDGAIKIRRNMHQHPPCAKCGTETTTAWHKGANNETICHDCSIALKQRHGSSSRSASTSNRSSARLRPSAATASISNAGRRISRSSGSNSRAQARTPAPMSSLYNGSTAYAYTNYQGQPYNFGSISTTSGLTADWQQTGTPSYIGSSLNTRYSPPLVPGAAADMTQNNIEQQITPISSYSACATPSTLPSSSLSSRPSSGSMHQDHLSLLTQYSPSSGWAATRPELTSAPQTKMHAQRSHRSQSRYAGQYHLSRQQQLGQNQFYSQPYSPYEIHRYRQYQQQLNYFQQQAYRSQQGSQYQGQPQPQPQPQSQPQPQFQYPSSYQHSQQQQQEQQQHCYHQPGTQYQYQNQYWYQNQQAQGQNQTQKSQVQNQAYDDVFQTYVQGVDSGSQPQWQSQSQDRAVFADINTTAGTEADTHGLEEGTLTYNHEEVNTNDAMVLAALVVESLSSSEEDAPQLPRQALFNGETDSQISIRGQEESSSAQQSAPAPVPLNSSTTRVESTERQYEELEGPRENEKHGEEQSAGVESNLAHEETPSSPMILNEQSNSDAGTSVDTNVGRGLRRSVRQRATRYTSSDPASKRQRYDEM